MMAAKSGAWFVRHPAIALLLLNVSFFALAAIVAEIVLRISIPFNPGYYIAVAGSSQELIYPYGTIYVNSDGFSDKEFDLGNPNRIGYFGDSVTYGTGAGFGYRLTELLEEVYPAYEHMNFGGLDLSANAASISYFAELAERYELDKAIYLLNLNDILTDRAVAGTEKTAVTHAVGWMRENLDWLRGKSYVYTYLRNLAKSSLAVGGTGWLGYPTYEFYPTEHEAVLRETAERVDLLAELMEQLGVEFTVVLLPYEMQISREAAEKYASLGVAWEDGFLEGKTQRLLAQLVDEDIRVLDAYDSLVDPLEPEKSRATNRLGEYFVYDKGDKLDWNHPNRAGHRKIADYLIRNEIFGPIEDRARAQASNEGR